MAKTAWLHIPEDVKPVLCFQGAANAVTCDTISTKNLIGLWFQVIHTGANDTDLTLTVTQATNVASATNKAGPAGNIWLDADAGTTSDTYVRQTSANAITIDPATQNGVMAIFQIDLSALDAAGGYDCVYLADSGGHASNICTILAYCQMREAQATPATVITD